LPVLPGFQIELRLLFQNLINNALKYQHRGNQPVISINAERVKNNFIFTVEDNGIGIEEKDREKIFIIFKRMHNRNQYEGTGIGLAHCKKIIELHHGKIWVDAGSKGGSAFRFSLPVSSDFEMSA
jgi:light-regulated signal transduction histidine kinase (bacteriophytochrome)